MSDGRSDPSWLGFRMSSIFRYFRDVSVSSFSIMPSAEGDFCSGWDSVIFLWKVLGFWGGNKFELNSLTRYKKKKINDSLPKNKYSVSSDFPK